MTSTDFETMLDRYAEVLVKVGLNVQPGQRVLIGSFGSKAQGAPLEAAPLVAAVAKHAYQVGARFVDAVYRDDRLRLARYAHAPDDSFDETAAWHARLTAEYFETGDAVLGVSTYDPNLLAGQNPDHVKTEQRALVQAAYPALQLIARSASNWLAASVPIPGWSALVLPDVADDQREMAMWDLIFEMCRIKVDDPVAGWRDHVAGLIQRADYLNAKQYDALHITGPGTDLHMGLPEGHIWRSGGMASRHGVFFTANIPTEEVFTLPHKDCIDGEVTSTKPLSIAGVVVEDFTLTLEGGRVVKATAKKGERALQDHLETDHGAASFGEIAIVPHSSPISQSGRLFYNILYDENASNHIALGNAYRFSMQGGETMSEEDWAAAGGNQSMIHTDFMIGSGAMDVDGILPDGTREAVQRGGEWAFEV